MIAHEKIAMQVRRAAFDLGITSPTTREQACLLVGGCVGRAAAEPGNQRVALHNILARTALSPNVDKDVCNILLLLHSRMTPPTVAPPETEQ